MYIQYNTLLTGFPAGFVLHSVQLCTRHTPFSKINFTTSSWRSGRNWVGENDCLIERYESCTLILLEWHVSRIGAVVGSSLIIIYLRTCGKCKWPWAVTLVIHCFDIIAILRYINDHAPTAVEVETCRDFDIRFDSEIFFFFTAELLMHQLCLLIVAISSYRITTSLTCSLLTCLAILRSVRNLIATPLIIFIDTPSCVFQFPTRYNVVSVKHSTI